MTSFLPPSDRVWWNVPVGKQEIVWIGIALVWCLIMFFMMPYWHIFGKQNLSNEAYQTTPAKFQAKVDEMVEKYKIGEEGGIPIVRPRQAAIYTCSAGYGSGIQSSNWKKIKPTACIYHRWTGIMVFLCSLSISTCKLFPVMKWLSQ